VATPQPLTNLLDALLLARVRRWVEVVFRQKSKCGQLDRDGRPWTRLPASDLARQLEEQEGVVVSVRRIQRSLARLVEAGYLDRQQRGVWRRDFWYSFAGAEWDLQQHRPTAAVNVTLASDPSRRNHASEVTDENLGIPSKNQKLLKTERTTASRVDGKNGCAGRQGAWKGQNDQRPQQPSASALQRRAGIAEGLKRAVQRASALGFGAKSGAPVPTQQAQHGETWVVDGVRYEQLANGLVVKDPLTTAPLR